MAQIIFKLFILLVLLLNSANAATLLDGGTTKYENFTVSYLYDQEGNLTIDDVVQADTFEKIPSQFTKGYRYGNAWFKLTFENRSPTEEFILYFTESIWTTFDFYEKRKDKWEVDKNGLAVALKKRSIEDSAPAFLLYIPQNETKTFYIKGSTIAGQVGEFELFTHDEYFRPTRFTLTQYYSIYVAILVAFILLNLYNFFMTREAIYGLYVVYIFTYIIFISMQSGLYINLGFPNWQEGLHTVGTLTLLTLILFSSEFLELKKTHKTMQLLFNVLAIGALIVAILLSQNLPYVTVLSNIYFCISLLTIVTVAIIILKEGFQGAKYYLLALTLYLPSMTLMALNFNTILPNTDLTRYSFLGGAFLEIFLFTLILTNRYKYIRQLNDTLKEKTQELQLVQKKLQKESVTDFLTGVYNRRNFSNICQKLIENTKKHNGSLCFVVVDIDYFKRYNDTYGHYSGDIILKKIATTIQESLGRANDNCFRLGGEEFGLIFESYSKESAKSFTESLRNSIESLAIEHSGNDASPYVTISAGAVCKKADQIENEFELYKEADDLLYKAKESGRNRVFFN